MKMSTLETAALEAEYKAILHALQTCNFNKSTASKVLGIDRKTLYNKLKKYKKAIGSTGISIQTN